MLIVLAAIAFLTFNVSREIRLLGTATSDNVQWSLSQTEVEFLEFYNRLQARPSDLPEVRRWFDVFYSRMATLQQSRVFADLRAVPSFRDELLAIQRFLDETVPLIDADDATLADTLPDLRARAQALRLRVRALSTAGLDLFAVASDAQRAAVARTMIELAAALAILIGMLGISVLYLRRLIIGIVKEAAQKDLTTSRLNAIIATSLDGVIVSDSQGRIVTFSPAAEAIFGYTSSEVVGRDLGDVIVPPHLRAAHAAGMERMRLNGEKRVVGRGRVRLEATRKGGDLFPVELAIQSSTAQGEELFIAFLRDISTRVANEQELVAARDTALASEKLKTEFLATMSHEIRTPLNGLLGNLDLLRDSRLDPRQDRFVRNMETSGRLLLRHISDVLDITRYEAGKMSVRSETMNLSHLMQEIIDSQSSMAAATGTTLDWAWDGPPHPWIRSDHDRLQHILLNLVGNAVKFTRAGKIRLTVSVSPQDDRLRLSFTIADNGPGMDPDLTARVFEDFVTGNVAYDRDTGGTGLGLGIAKRFVQALDGEIGVESTLGQGSTFWVHLPVDPARPASRTVTASDGEPASGPLSVLLVEDNEINRTVARDMLEDAGHRVVDAGNGEEGVDLARAQRFDLILMDISMPVMDGRTATKAIRDGSGLSNDVPIIALTANAMRDEQDAFLADGMDGVLTKPLSKAALADVLSKISTPVGVSPRRVACDPLVDRAQNAETCQMLGAESYGTLIGRFADEMDGLLVWLSEFGALEPAEVAAQAHKVAGSAAIFGACGLRDQLQRIETRAKTGEVDRIGPLVVELEELWTDSRRQLG